MITKGKALLWLLVIVFAIVCFSPTFVWLNFKFLAKDSFYSHGYLIPFVSAYLIYTKRRELKFLPVSSATAGLWVIVGSLVVHVLAVLGNINFLSGFALVFYITGVCLYLLGTEWTRQLVFPLFFLVFMCPIPDNFINVIALPTKSLATSIGLYGLDLLNIPYVREGFRIHLADSMYLVGTPCNGMRSLISFLALGVLFMGFIRASLIKKVLFLVVIPPISILLNGIRIFMLLFIANHYGQEAASPESYLHDGSGLFVFVLGVTGLILLSRVLNEGQK